MKYKRIISYPQFADWLVDCAHEVPKHASGITFPAVFPYEEIAMEGVETEYIIHPGVPYKDLHEDDAAQELEKLSLWYDDFSARGMPGDQIQLLLQARNRMAIALKPFGVDINAVEVALRNARYRRDVKTHKLKALYRDNGMTASAADHQVMVDCKENYDEVTSLNKLWKDLKAAMESHRQTLNAMAGVRGLIQQESQTPQPGR